MSKKKSAGVLSVVLSIAASLCFAAQPDLTREVRFEIPAQRLSQALIAFSDQSGIQVVTAGEDVSQLATPGVSGRLPISAALEKLLTGTALAYSTVGDSTVALTSRVSQSVALERDFKLASAGPQPAEDETARPAAAQTDAEAGQIVVTGSHIRGVKNSPSPVMVFDREDIDRSGYATVQQFIQALPQNFGGGQTESSARNISGVDSATRGTGINLRNLGVGSTLTLLNGRRLAPSGLGGEFIDISMIPVTAVERIDVLTDGASAIYGSDAVAGVVNFTLRDDYEGAQTRLRYGSPTSGPSDEFQFAQVLGKAWNSGHVLANYEHYRRRPLSSSERPYTADALDPYYLLPDQERDSVFVAGSQQLAPRAQLYGHLSASRRKTDGFSSSSGTTTQLVGESRQYGATLGARLDFKRDWQADVAAGYDKATYDGQTRYPTLGLVVIADVKTAVGSVDVKADGPVFSGPGGVVRLAVGGQARNEEYEYSLIKVGDRDVYAAFTEVSVPLVGAGNRRPGVELLTFTGAVRYEDYSDFGEATNPKFGVLWSPVGGLNLRATYGTSFKVPTFDDIRNDGLVTVTSLADPRGGRTPTFLLANSNSRLQPEEATIRTAGLDIQPRALPGLSVQLTYFDIEYTERIGRAFSSFAALLSDGDGGYGGALFARNPTLAFIQNAVAQSSRYTGVSAAAQAILNGTTPVTSVGAFADFRLHNLAGVQMDGLDFSASYGFEAGLDRFELQFGGQYLLNDDRRVTSTAPVNEVLNKPFNSVDLRLRNSLNWSRGEWGASVFVNYVDSYSNTNVLPVERVSSWTTADLTVRYGMEGRAGSWLDGTVISASCINLFDNDPPYLNNPVNRLNFDGSNAEALGRFVSLQLTKSWGRQ